jgi:hypothetical protein
MIPLTNRLVSTTTWGSRGLGGILISADFLNDCRHITQHFFWIVIRVAILYPINDGEAPFALLLQQLEILRTDHDRNRTTALFDDDRFLAVIDRAQNVGELLPSLLSRIAFDHAIISSRFSTSVAYRDVESQVSIETTGS